MDDNEYKIYCANCGAEMSSNSRYCMKCGTLNYNHEANKNMKEFMPKDIKNSYQVGSGKFFSKRQKRSLNGTVLAAHTGNQKICFLLNFFLFVIFILGSFLICEKGDYTISHIVSSSFPVIAVMVSLVFFYLYAFQLLFIKCNLVWWKALIPIYNLIVLSDALFRKKWIGIVACIPGIGIIGILAIMYKLGVKFQYNGFFTALIPIISIPMIGYGNHLYDGCIFAEGDPNLALEKEYKRKKSFLITVGIIFVFGIGILIYNKYTSSDGTSFSLDNYYYVYAAKQITKKVEKNIDKGIVSCTSGEYISNQGIYYFYFDDLGDEVFLPLYIMRETIEGYVKVDNTSGVSHYFISLTDGNKGFSEIPIEEVHGSSVKKYSKLIRNNYVSCNLDR